MTEQEFNTAIYPYRERMFALARSIVSDQMQAEDVISDVLLKVWQRCRIFGAPSNTAAFLMKSTRNACYDLLRKRKTEMKIFAYGEEAESRARTVGREPDAGDWDTRRLINEAMDSLTEQQRTVEMLKDIYGYETVDIALMLDLEENNVRAILSRARKAMREYIEKRMKFNRTR